MSQIELSFESEVSASPQEAWEWIMSVDGISQEISPYLRMTTLDGVESPRGTPMIDEKKAGLDASYAADSANDNRSVYRDWAASDDKDFVGSGGYQFGKLIAEAFVKLGGSGPLLDAGCGTGLVAEHLPESIVVDGVDFSPEMLAIAERKKRYRALFEADLTKPLALEGEAYAGLTCAGTFTQGHVGPEALAELLRVLRPGAICAISGKPPFYETSDFPKTFESLVANKVITPPSIRKERVYRADATPPKGHENDIAYLITFQKC